MSDLTVALTTTITVNGSTRETINQVIIPAINQYDNRVMSIPYNIQVPILSFGAQVGAGTFISGELEYLSIANLDAVNYAQINVSKVSTYGFNVRLDPGKMFVMGNTKEYATSVGATFVTFVDYDTISMQAIGSSPIDIEYVVATT
jgi:hypothetical protein